MWVLVIILYIPGVYDIASRLSAHETHEKCIEQAMYIATEMMTAYPNERDTWLTCRLEQV